MATPDPVELYNIRGPVGLLWSDGDHLAFASVESESSDLVNHLTSLVETSNKLGVGPDVMFDIVLERARKYDISLHIRDGLTAAAAPEDFQYVEKSPYTLSIDEDGTTVLGLVYNDGGEITVREDGEWLKPLEDDARFYSNEFHFVTEDAVELFDRLVEDKSVPTAADFNEVYVD